MFTVDFGALRTRVRICRHDHLPCLEGDLEERVVDLLEIDFRHIDQKWRGKDSRVKLAREGEGASTPPSSSIQKSLL